MTRTHSKLVLRQRRSRELRRWQLTIGRGREFLNYSLRHAIEWFYRAGLRSVQGQVEARFLDCTFSNDHKFHQISTVVFLLPVDQSTSNIFSTCQWFIPQCCFVSRSKSPVRMISARSGRQWAEPTRASRKTDLEVLLSNWNILHMSDCRFLLFSELTALASRSVQEESNSGEMKNWANRSKAPSKAVGWISKLDREGQKALYPYQWKQPTSNKCYPFQWRHSNCQNFESRIRYNRSLLDTVLKDLWVGLQNYFSKIRLTFSVPMNMRCSQKWANPCKSSGSFKWPTLTSIEALDRSVVASWMRRASIPLGSMINLIIARDVSHRVSLCWRTNSPI